MPVLALSLASEAQAANIKASPASFSPKVNLILVVEDRMQARKKGLKIDLRHVSRAMLVSLCPLPNPAPAHLFPTRPCENAR